MATVSPTDIDIVIKVNEQTGEHEKFRQCTACKRHDILLASGLKRCARCRERSRNYRKAANALKSANAGPSVETKSSLNKHKKRSAEKSLNELTGEEHERALKLVKNSVNATIRKSNKKSPVTGPMQMPPSEYQKASSLYDAARIASGGSSPCNFLGQHSIVRCDDIDNHRRANLVVNDLRKLVKIPFKYDHPLSRLRRGNAVELIYSCSCNAAAVKRSKSGDVTSSRKSSGVIGWAEYLNGVRGDENVDSTMTPCGGKVTVTVQDDHSHTLDIPGQQVKVQISH